MNHQRFNLFRYLISITAIIIVGIISNGLMAIIITTVLAIFLNYVFDDLSVYVSAVEPQSPKDFASKDQMLIYSPTDGIVIKSEPNRYLFEDIIDLRELKETLPKTEEWFYSIAPYHHVALSANEFSCPIVTHGGMKIVDRKEYNALYRYESTIDSCEIVHKVKRSYQFNRLFVVEYESGIISVVTIDKESEVDLINWRWDSQLLGIFTGKCYVDLYTPMTRNPHINVNVGDSVKINDSIGCRNYKEEETLDIAGLRREFLGKDAENFLGGLDMSMAKSLNYGLDKLYGFLCHPICLLYLLFVLGSSALHIEYDPTGEYLIGSLFLTLVIFYVFSRPMLISLMNLSGHREWMSSSYKQIKSFLKS
jgi:hypothetical protein